MNLCSSLAATVFFRLGCLILCVYGLKLSRASVEFIKKLDQDADSKSVTVSVDLDNVVAETGDRFLSFALDTGLIVKHWKSVDFGSEKFNALAHGLSPAYLRVGGNAADFLVFRKELDFKSREWDSRLFDENYDGNLGFRNISEFYMSAHDFDAVNKFAVRNNLHLLFDFNVLLRDAHDQWNSSNAREILEYSIDKGYDSNLLFSLGNEPNSFPHAFNRSVPPDQLGKDFLALSRMLRTDPYLSKHYRSSLLVGPDVTQPKVRTLQYLNDFLDVAESVVNAVTIHQYYIDGRTADLDDMLSVDNLDILSDELDMLHKSLMKGGHNNLTLWFGETGSCWGGGASGLSDRYVAGFMWLDKLGLTARNGFGVVVRQSFFHGHYALVDQDFDPNPDYWLSWLFKNLVGRRVFAADVQESTDVRIYAHCAQQPRYSRGAVVVYGLNTASYNVTLMFNGRLINSKKHLYWLYPYGHSGLKSKEVYLFGEEGPLQLDDDNAFPVVRPVIISEEDDVVVGGQSFGFIVFPDAKVAQCA